MPQVIVIAHSASNPNDITLDTKLPKRGDVIDAVDTGTRHWGTQERSDALFRIIEFPSDTLATCQSLLSGEVPTDPEHPPSTLQFRAFYLDLDSASIPADMAAYLADDDRAAVSFTAAASVTIAALKVQRPPVAPPTQL